MVLCSVVLGAKRDCCRPGHCVWNQSFFLLDGCVCGLPVNANELRLPGSGIRVFLLHMHSRSALTNYAADNSSLNEQAVDGRPPRYAPVPLLPPWAPKRLAPPSRRQRSSSFPRPARSHAHRCSRLTRQHGREQSGLVILIFDLLSLKVVPESRVTRATLCQFWSS